MLPDSVTRCRIWEGPFLLRSRGPVVSWATEPHITSCIMQRPASSLVKVGLHLLQVQSFFRFTIARR